jgi:hypothetical protein
VRVGGNWNNGRNCSPVYFNCNNAPSDSNINYLARLFYGQNRKYKDLYARLIPCPLAKIVETAGTGKQSPNAPETIKKETVMKSYNVDQKLKDRDVIRLAIIKVCKNKHKKKRKPTRKYKQARKILQNIDLYVDLILEIIEDTEKKLLAIRHGETIREGDYPKAFTPSEYKSFTLKCDSNGKVREISSVPLFPDQIIHQLVITVSASVFMSGMYAYSCGSIPERGVHKGKRYVEKFIRKSGKYDKSAIKYVAQLDVRKCYPNIDHTYLKEQLRKKFRGFLFVGICFSIIDSYVLTSDAGAEIGLPIGFYTSQWFCNFVLSPLDHYIKEGLGTECYVRYMDDMVIFGRNKKELHRNVRQIMEFATKAGLQIKGNWQVYRFDYCDRMNKRRGRALDFLGFRFFRDKIILRKRNALSIRRAVRRVARMKRITAVAAMSLMSRLGWLRHCQSYNFYHKYVKPFIKIRKLKEVIRNESRKRNNAGRPV